MTPTAPTAGRRRAARIGAATALSLVAAGVAALLWPAGPPEGPVAPVWDRTVCARCGMLVSDPAWAAQLHAPDGAVLHFDDPGCLLLHRAERGSPAHALWFHHLREERWLSGPDVGFVPAGPSPMGYGLGAVDADTPGALGLEAAARRLGPGGAVPRAEAP